MTSHHNPVGLPHSRVPCWDADHIQTKPLLQQARDTSVTEVPTRAPLHRWGNRGLSRVPILLCTKGMTHRPTPEWV